MKVVHLIDNRTGKPVDMAEQAWVAMQNRPFGKLHYSVAKQVQDPPEIQHLQKAAEPQEEPQEEAKEAEPVKDTVSGRSSARSNKNKSAK